MSGLEGVLGGLDRPLGVFGGFWLIFRGGADKAFYGEWP